jgi:hypothetical protein
MLRNLVAAFGIVLVTAGGVYAATCSTTCQRIGNFEYCNTSCY